MLSPIFMEQVMIKECKVLFYNKYLSILVFDFNGKQIQTTAKLDTECKTVFVKYKDGKYEVVSKDEYEKYNKNFKKKKIVINSDKNAEIDNSEL